MISFVLSFPPRLAVSSLASHLYLLHVSWLVIFELEKKSLILVLLYFMLIRPFFLLSLLHSGNNSLFVFRLFLSVPGFWCWQCNLIV